MGLFMTPRRKRALKRLWMAGDLDAYHFTEGELLEAHGLAEAFSDSGRILKNRYRITWQGEKIARFLFTKEGA